MAKMMQQEEEKFFGYLDSTGRLMAKNRHWSLTDLPRSHIDEEIKVVRRWNSLSNDEMMRIRELEPQKMGKNLVQMANITVFPRDQPHPRKFSKYNPPKRKKVSRNSTEELIYIRQNFPHPGNPRNGIWSRHSIPRNNVASPSIAHVNSFGMDNSNTSSEANSRASSILNMNPTRNEIDKMVEEGLNSMTIVDESLAKNIGETPLNSSEDRSLQESSSKSAKVTPRYMNWYNKSQSSITQATLDAKQLTKSKERRSNSVPQSNKVSPVNQTPVLDDDDTESGISSMSQQGVQKNELLQKKQMFHMAFDDMVNQQLLPGFADNSEEV